MRSFKITGLLVAFLAILLTPYLSFAQEAKPKTLLALPYPSATLMRAYGSQTIYGLNDDNEKVALVSPYTLSPYIDFSCVVDVDPLLLQSYADGGLLPLALGKLYKGQNSGTVYYVDWQFDKRPFASAEVFNALGYKWDQINIIPDNLLNLNTTGAIINTTDKHPSSSLVKVAGNPTVYYLLSADTKTAFTSHQIFELYFHDREVITISQSELDSYGTYSYTPVPPGVLVKSENNSTVYFIDLEFKKHPFTSSAVFTLMGYKWANVHTLPDLDLGFNQPGTPINLPVI